MQKRLLTMEQARRFLLRKQGLLGDWRFAGKEGALAYVRQAGCIQFDNETKYGTMINSGVHRGFSNEYDQDWFYFFKGSPTKDQAIRFGKMLSGKYGFKIYFQ